MITRDSVISAYLTLLQREPENEGVVENWIARCADVDDLLEGIIGSMEFQTRRVRKAISHTGKRLAPDEVLSEFSVYPAPDLLNWLRNLHLIQGMVEPVSAYISAALSQFQARKGLGGNVAEIGVFHGKYLMGLALSLQKNERAIAVDVFEDQFLNRDVTEYDESGVSVIHSLTQDIFLAI